MPIKIASNDLSIPLYTAIGRWRLSICDRHPTQRRLARFDTVHLSLKPMIAAPGVFKQSPAPVRSKPNGLTSLFEWELVYPTWCSLLKCNLLHGLFASYVNRILVFLENKILVQQLIR